MPPCNLSSPIGPKRILLLAHNWDYLPLASYSIGLRLSKRGYNVSLLIPSEKASFRLRKETVNSLFTLYFCPTILRGGLKKGSDPFDLMMRMYLVSKLQYDVVFAFDSRPTVILPAVLGRMLKKVPLIIYWTDWFGRGGIISERSGKLYRFFFEKIETFFEEYFCRYADSYAVICNSLEKRLKALGFCKDIHFLPFGCDNPTVLDVDTNQIRNKLMLPQGKALIGCVGSLSVNDADLLFKSFNLLKEKIEVQLVLIGKNIFRDRYEIPEGVIETGKLSDEHLEYYVRSCDLMVIPLRNNIANNGRWPSKLNSYLVSGKPVLSTNISVVAQLLKIAKFGDVAEDSPDVFSQEMYRLLTDKALLGTYGRNAIQLASGYLSWPTIMNELEKILLTTIEKHKELNSINKRKEH